MKCKINVPTEPDLCNAGFAVQVSKIIFFNFQLRLERIILHNGLHFVRVFEPEVCPFELARHFSRMIAARWAKYVICHGL